MVVNGGGTAARHTRETPRVHWLALLSVECDPCPLCVYVVVLPLSLVLFCEDPQRDRVPRADRPTGVDGRARQGSAGLREGHHPKRGASRLPPTTWTKNLYLRQKYLTVSCYRTILSIGRVHAPGPWLLSNDGMAAFRRWFAK